MNEERFVDATCGNRAFRNANRRLAAAFGLSLISCALLVLVALLLPSLLSAAAGLFVFFGVPIALLSVVLQLIGTGLLISANPASNRGLYVVTLVSTVLCWMATLTVVLIVVVGFAMMTA